MAIRFTGQGMRRTRGGTRPPTGEESAKAGPMACDGAMRGQHPVVREGTPIWVPCAVSLLGLGIMLAPLAFDYGGLGAFEPAGGRGVWLDRGERVRAMQASDAWSGFVLLICGIRGLAPARKLWRWVAGAVGAWLSFAPVLFWSPSPVAYVQDTLVGGLVVALTVLGIPGAHVSPVTGDATGEDGENGAIPPAWTYNPSSWAQRGPLIVLSFACWIIARWLAAFQLGYVTNVWDPFGTGTRAVLTSSLSRAWPVSDAALGAVAYMYVFLLAVAGGPQRWRTAPWTAIALGALLAILGIGQVAMAAAQPLLIGAWCPLCLLTAALVLPLLPWHVDELIAAGQVVMAAHRRGESAWRALWRGTAAPGSGRDWRSPDLARVSRQTARVTRGALWGLGWSWNLGVQMALGVWLLVAPSLFRWGIAESSLEYGAGIVVLALAVLSLAEPLRAVRWLNVLPGLALCMGSWAVHQELLAAAHGITVGVLLALMCLPRGIVYERYGPWDAYIL